MPKGEIKPSSEVRNTIKRLGSRLLEELPTPIKSIQELKKEKNLKKF